MNRFRRVLITGAGGMLGSAIVPAFGTCFPHVLPTDCQGDLPRLDVRDEGAIARVFAEFEPDLVLHLAAATDLEWCETHGQEAAATNTVGTRYVAQACRHSGATLIYISTAGVFDGEKRSAYTESDIPNPINLYGWTKAKGEDLTRLWCPRHYIVRAGWMIGGGPRDHKFVALILQQLREGRRIIHVVNDLFGTPTYTVDFAANLLALLETQQYGTYHMVCEGSASRYDVAQEIIHLCGADAEVVPVPSSYFAARYFVRRPRSEILQNAALSALRINQMRPWQEALAVYLASLRGTTR